MIYLIWPVFVISVLGIVDGMGEAMVFISWPDRFCLGMLIFVREE